MTDQPSRVTPGEISDLLDQFRHLAQAHGQATPADRLAYFERKADLLARIAAHLGTDEAREVAAAARAQVTALRAGHDPAAREVTR